MPLLKILAMVACCALLAMPEALAREKYGAPVQVLQADSSESEEKFDSFLDQLIERLQSTGEHSAVKDRFGSTRDTDRDDEDLDDAHDVITGDHHIEHDETVDGDVYVKDGTLTVAGIIRGNATVVQGDIIVLPGGRITGNAHAVNGSIRRERNGIIEGDIHESTSLRTGFFGRLLRHRSSYTFGPRWLHENTYVESPIFRYNRVEGVYVGLSSAKKFYWDGRRIISGYGSIGYGFLTHRWRGQLGLDRQFATSAGLFEFGGEGHNLTDTKDEWLVGQTENTLAAFLFRQDYRDYFQRAGYSVHTAWYTKEPGLFTMFNAEYKYDEYESLLKQTNWSLFRKKNDFRDNPGVNEGIMRSIALTAGVSTVGSRTAMAGWNTSVQAEFGGHGLGGDFSFTRAIVDVRRYQPLSKCDRLDMRLRFGSLEGDATVQKAFEIGGVSTLPAFGFKQFAGNRMMLGNIEYALNGSVFNDVSFWPGFLTTVLFADAGDAQVVDANTSVTDGFGDFSLHNLKSDIGFALAWHDDSARLGFAWRTDQSGPPMVFIRLTKPF